MEDNTENNTGLMSKKADDLTVGEAIKLNLGVLAVFCAVPIVFAGGSVAVEKISNWRMNRKLEKELSETTDPDVTV